MELALDLLQPGSLQLLVNRTLREIAETALPKRRQRTCARIVQELERV